MKGISINGVEYLPATALAKQFRYTTDYIGQLCRAKKVDAQLVGRSWYVNPSSLTNHKQARYTKSSLGKNTAEESNKITISRLEVAPVVNKNTIKMSPHAQVNFSKHIDWKPLRYEADAADLLPQFETMSEPRRVNVDLADSTEITIKNTSQITDMVAEELPTVSLKGKLNVSSIDDSFDVMKDEVPSLADIPLPPLPAPLPRPIKPISRPIHHSLPIKPSVVRVMTNKKAGLALSAEAEVATEAKSSSKIAGKPIPSSLFIPKSVLQSQVEAENGIEFMEVALLTSTGVLVLCLLLLIFGESSLEANSASYTWGIDFSTHSLAALVSLFSN